MNEDKIVIRGKSPDLVYFWIHNDKVEIRDASQLKGKGAQETAHAIKDELNDPDIQVAAIGLAGENRLFMATIEHFNASAARGVGVIMGDKRLKAIAVRGTKDLYASNPEELFKVCLQHYQDIHESPFKANGSWIDQIGKTWVLNAGSQIGDVPAHIILDLESMNAEWYSLAGSDSRRLM